jgi:signal peptidase I
MMSNKDHPGMRPRPDPRGKAFLAFAASCLCPGLGHAMAGYYRRAVIMFLTTLLFLAAFIVTLTVPRYVTALPLLFPLALLAQFSQLLDAADCGINSRTVMFPDKYARYIVGCAMLAFALAGLSAEITFLQDYFVDLDSTPTSDMTPAILTTDSFLERRNAPFTRWDIVVLNSPVPPYSEMIARVVGLPGEKIEITGDGLTIDDRLTPLPPGVDRYLPMDTGHAILDSPSPGTAANGCWGKPITLAPNEYFLLGDNSPVANDARFWPSIYGHQPGAMPRNQIIARVVAITWPTSRWCAFPSPVD